MTVREQVLAFVKKEYGTKPRQPWVKYPENDVLAHDDNDKWYGLIMPVLKCRVGMRGEGYVDILNVKLDPALIDMLRVRDGFLPAYHMNKVHWISIRLDGSVELETIFDLIAQSFDMTASRPKGK